MYKYYYGQGGLIKQLLYASVNNQRFEMFICHMLG